MTFLVIDRSKRLIGFRRGCTYDPRGYTGVESVVRKAAMKLSCDADLCNDQELEPWILRDILSNK